MAATPKDKTIRVGVLITVALAVLMVFLFFIGSESKIWARKNEYEVRFESVAGLAEGNPVKISGVTVGVVRDIRLPRDPKKRAVEISLMVDRKYAERIRGDSRARLKKLGLLAGDSYIDITPGDPRFPTVDPGSVIPAQRETNVDQLISSGEDLVDNFVQISYSLKNILGRVDRGEGLIGELTTSPETKQRLTDTFLLTLNKTNAALAHMESGRGVAGKLIYDDKFAEQLTTSLLASAQSLQAVASNVQKGFESGTGVLPALMHDPEAKKRVYDLVDNLRTTSANLATFSTSLQTGQGLVPRLINDKAYGDQALNEFTGLVHQLNETVSKLNSGQGTAGKLITDPSVYESINDILIGINESKLLRWLIRNRQQSGIQQRYNEQQKTAPANAPPAPAPPPASDVPPPPAATPPVTTTTTTTTTTAVPPPY
ncbi:MAG TPA: MlaD family protein [Thermoanaerobaculia bacterium]|jgi:phospholipid/cholesterol/gamma-HCH transport system substrate-binding protein